MQVYSDPSRESDPHALPDVEVFHQSAEEIAAEWGLPVEDVDGGWFYCFCFPGCLPDSEPVGPFATADEAKAAAQDEAQDDFNASLSSHIDPRDLR